MGRGAFMSFKALHRAGVCRTGLREEGNPAGGLFSTAVLLPQSCSVGASLLLPSLLLAGPRHRASAGEEKSPQEAESGLPSEQAPEGTGTVRAVCTHAVAALPLCLRCTERAEVQGQAGGCMTVVSIWALLL